MNEKRKILKIAPNDIIEIEFDFCCDELKKRYIEFPMVGTSARLIVIDEIGEKAFSINANILHDSELEKIKKAIGWGIEKIEKCPFCGKELFIK